MIEQSLLARAVRAYASKTAESCRQRAHRPRTCHLLRRHNHLSNHVNTRTILHGTKLTTWQVLPPTSCAQDAPNPHRSSSHLGHATNEKPQNPMCNYDKRSSNDNRKACYREKKAQLNTPNTRARSSARRQSCCDTKTADAALQTTPIGMQTTDQTLTRGLDTTPRAISRFEP